MEKHPLHLKAPEFQASPEVTKAVESKERAARVLNEKLTEAEHEGPLLKEKVAADPTRRIEAYMDRLENIFLNPDERVRKRNLKLLKSAIYDALIIKRENFSESYFEFEKKLLCERGEYIEELSEDKKEELMNTAILNQEESLDEWMNFLTSEENTYPTWFKYYTWTQIIKLSQLDKERGQYKNRTESTVAPFPDIYNEPLAEIADLYEKYPEILKEVQSKDEQLRSEKNTLKKSLSSASSKEEKALIKEAISEITQKIEEVSEPTRVFDTKFSTLYAQKALNSLVNSIENAQETAGTWVKYNQGDMEALEELFNSVKGKGTGWCTTGRATARQQLENGDFYVFYSNDSSNQPTQPRLAILMLGDQIKEVRGILPNQAVETPMQEILDDKLKEFGPKAEQYSKKSHDMRLLKSLSEKQDAGKDFTKDELVFLYELHRPIESFAGARDLRIEELQKRRNIDDDIKKLFECEPEQIARSSKDITDTTKVYIGALDTDIFTKFPKNLEHIYSSFPDGRIHITTINPEQRTVGELTSKVEENNIKISPLASSMFMNKKEFIPGKYMESVSLVQITASDLGFTKGATFKKIIEKAQKLGLELCSHDIALQLALNGESKTVKSEISIGMNPISDSTGHKSIFDLAVDDLGISVSNSWTDKNTAIGPNQTFLFCKRESSAKKPRRFWFFS
ncbi:MAG TPA: hypothetical protein VGE63_02170 [Candidatus Paceibacterota bacterium]